MHGRAAVLTTRWTALWTIIASWDMFRHAQLEIIGIPMSTVMGASY